MSKSKSSTTQWAFFILGLGGMVVLSILKAESQSFDSSGYGWSNFDAGLRAAQNHYEFREMMESIYPPLMIISLVVAVISGISISRSLVSSDKNDGMK
jgi:hypothetical protein